MKTKHIVKVAICYLIMVLDMSGSFRCDRKPYGTQFQVSPSDGRFKLTVLGADDNAYIPDQVYIVQLAATDEESHFTGFMISAEGDGKPDPHNPRRVISQYPGEVRPSNPLVAKFSDRCPYSVEQAMNSVKSSVEVYWQAPQSGNGCVTLRAMVVENDELWFEDGAPLAHKVCEDMRQPDDVAPQLNYDCDICDEAKYEVSFTGIWSRNTHPRLYPENDWVPRYSDLVGASHSAELILWSPGSLASDGLKELAEYANTSKFEQEIREKIGDGVRTMIKGKGHGYRKMGQATYSFFRADKENHLFSVAVGIHPSPDWFLGVTRFELCQDGSWLPERELNLYPWDAGTDNGVSYESANIPTVPQDDVARVQMSSYDKNSPFFEMEMKDLHPFAKLHITLVRTYHRECEEVTEEPKASEETTEKEEEEGTEETEEETEEEEESKGEEEEEGKDVKQPEPETPSRYQNPDIASGISVGRTTEAPVVTEPEMSGLCPMSQWSPWSPCEGACEGNKIRGYKWRERYHLVDGIAVEKYDPNAKHSHKKAVPKYCKEHFDDFERNDCEEDCPDSQTQEENAERRMTGPAKPGYMYLYGKKRELRKNMKN